MKMLIRFEDKFPSSGQNAFVVEGAKIIGEVEIGDESSVWFNCIPRGDVNFIKIGKRTNIQDLTIIHVWHKKFNKDGSLKNIGFPTYTGDDVTIGHNCVIHACKIGSRMPAGMNAVIMGDTAIGDDSIVGTGSVITKGKKFPPESLILGNPTKLIRELSDEEVASLKQSTLDYVEFKNDFSDRLKILTTLFL